MVAVFHRETEDAEVVNIKKGIAAAFQANFKRTAEEVETDLDSKHTSHYRFEKIRFIVLILISFFRYVDSPNGTTKMYRTFTNDDVIEYATHVDTRALNLVETEEVQYRDGMLLKSNGTMHVSVERDEVCVSISPSTVVLGI